MYEYLVGSLILLVVWFILYAFVRRDRTSRKEMLKVSILTSFLGLTEPIFVPEYWNPTTLFNLASKTGFDIESLIFAFAVGGLASVLYESIFKVKHIKISKKVMRSPRHRFHRLALISPLIFFLILEILTGWNPIYTISLGIFLGSIAYMWCRPDLTKKMLYGSITFLGLYFVLFLVFNLLFPGWVQETWNFNALSGILLLGVPIEEMLFASTFGLLWAGLYEHLYWYKLK